MSIRSRLFGSSSDNTSDSIGGEDSTEGESSGYAVDVDFGAFFSGDSVPPAYSRKFERKFDFSERVRIDTREQGEFASVVVSTPVETVEFDIRISEYTSRFGVLDAEFISVGSCAFNVYYPIQDSDEWFVRRLFFYADEGGVGSERLSTYSSPPTNPCWTRETDYGDICTTTVSSRVEVYDWRENMLTSGKPTPGSGEVVLQYYDSLRTGGNRSPITTVLTVTDISMVDGTVCTVDFIRFDSETGQYILYCQQDEGYLIGEVPISSDVSSAAVDWYTDDGWGISPYRMDAVIWVRSDVDTWAADVR